MGVGDDTATVAAATTTHILRDATGMIGRIVFAWYQGSDLDNNAKQWRLVADILNDFAMMVELISPAFPTYFLLMGRLSDSSLVFGPDCGYNGRCQQGLMLDGYTCAPLLMMLQ